MTVEKVKCKKKHQQQTPNRINMQLVYCCCLVHIALSIETGKSRSAFRIDMNFRSVTD